MKPDGVEGDAQGQPVSEGKPAPASAPNSAAKAKAGDAKAKSKPLAKPKTPTSATKTPATLSRPSTGTSRLTNGSQKAQANGVEKKTSAGTPEKKSSARTAAGTASAPTTKTKVGDKKPADGNKTAAAGLPTRKPTGPANGLKPKPKTTAPRPASASSAAASPKPESSVSKTTRTTTPAARPSSAAAKPPAPSKTPASASRTAKTPPAKTAAPPAGRTPTQPKTTTPIKKDVSKQPSTPAAKKPPSASLTRPSLAKTPKPDPVKSATKPISSPKSADLKTSKPKESKATPSKDTSAGVKSSKPSPKTSSPKKMAGSTTPMPVKGGPKLSTPADPPQKALAVAEASPTTAVVSTPEAPEAVFNVPLSSAEPPKDSPSPTNLTVHELKSEKSATAPALEDKCDKELTAHIPHDPQDEVEHVLSSVCDTQSEAIADSNPPQEAALPPDSPADSDQELGESAVSAIPPAFDKTPEFTRPAFEELEHTATPLIPSISDGAPEDTVTPVVSPLSEEAELVYSHDLTVGVDLREDEGVSQLAADVNLFSLEEPEHGVSPLGTTVLSPPSSPTGPAGSVLLDHPSSGLSQDLQGLIEPWAQSVSLCSSSACSVQSKEHEEERDQDNLVMFSAAKHQTKEEDLANRAHEDHITNAVYVSPWQDREEAVEKADEEINEDDEEEEEEEEVPIYKPSPHAEVASEKMKEVTDLSSCAWSMKPSDAERESVVHKSADLLFSKPFEGPPGIQSVCSEDEDEDIEEDRGEEGMEVDSEPDERHQQEQKKEADSGLAVDVFGACADDDYLEEGHQTDMAFTAQTTSVPLQTPWNPSSFSDSWTHQAPTTSESSQHQELFTHTYSFLAEKEAAVMFSADPYTPPKSPVEMFADKVSPPEPQPGVKNESALAEHRSETSSPEELQEYDSSSGVESRSDKPHTPLPAMQTDLDQDLGIHLDRGDGEEKEAETLPADEVPGDGGTAPPSFPPSQSTSGDEASDVEGEMQTNELHDQKLAATEDVGDVAEHLGEEDGDTPHSANSVASYGFDCSASNSNPHSTAESCGKSPGIFSLENEEQLPEEAKDPSFIRELTLPAAAAYHDDNDLLGRPVDLLPIRQSHTDEDQHYMTCSKMGQGAKEEEPDPESPMHLSPQHAGDSDSQPPYYSTVCDKTDSFLAAQNWPSENANHPAQEINHNHYIHLQPVSSTDRPAATPEVQPRRSEQQQLQLRRMQQRQEQERMRRLCVEEERQRREQQKALERQRRELLQLQLQQQQQEHRLRRQILQRQLELQQQQLVSPSSGLCTIYEAMETSEDEEVESGFAGIPDSGLVPTDLPLRVANGNLRQEAEWNAKLDVVQRLINQALLLAGEEPCPPLLYLPGPGGGVLSPLESSLWPHLTALLGCSAATVASVSSFCPSSQTCSPRGDWTVVELETYH